MSSTQTFGVTAQGFVAERQSDIQADLQAAWMSAFGQNVNLSASSNNGQIIGIMSERFALLWELLEAIYNSQYPSGAEGTSVDNILALNNLTRLPATFSTTNNAPVVQSNDVTLYGLVCTGTPGTVVPGGSLIADTSQPPNIFATDNPITILAAQNAVQTVIMSNAPTSGSFALGIVAPSGNTLSTPAISYLAQATQALLWWPKTPTQGTFTLSITVSALGAVSAKPLAFNCQATDVQQALRTATGSSDIVVTGSVAAGMYVGFGQEENPTLSADDGDAAPMVVNSIQSAINQLYDSEGLQSPYTDVAVSQTGTAIGITFGANTAVIGSPSSAGTPQPLFTIASNSLFAGSTATNLSVADTVAGAPAQGVGSATATTTGPMAISAGGLSVIQTPVSGWTGVDNQLDVVSGQNVETDEAALLRRSTLLSAQAQGPVAAVLQAVLQVPGVTAALAFQNLSHAAQQTLIISSTPESGGYALAFDTGTTTSIPYNASPSQVQGAISALPGYGPVTVSGNATYGYTIDFNGSAGGQGVPLCNVVNNTTGVPVSTGFGRPPKSVEVVAQGGDAQAIAEAIYGQGVAGNSTYGAPALVTTGTVTAGSTSMSVLSTVGIEAEQAIVAYGINPGTQVVSVFGNTVTLSETAIGSYSGTRVTFNWATEIRDSNGNGLLVAFSRPVQIPVYTLVSLLTDYFQTPGVASSGVNAQAKFNPANIPAIQSAIVSVGKQVPIGGLIVAMGTNGIIGSFSEVPGIISYTLTFGTSPNPTSAQNVQLLPTQSAYWDEFNVAVSFQ